VAGALV
jgi:hypothetical protein